MKSFFLSVLLIIGYTLMGFSQNAIGVHFDADGNPFLNDYDPFLYTPSESLTAYVWSNQFVDGTITYANQSGTEAKLKFINGKLYIQATNESKEIKINANEIVSARIGPDSLFSISQYKTVSYIRQIPQTLVKNGPRLCLYEGEAYNQEFASLPKSNKSNSPAVFLIRPKNTSDWYVIDISVKKKYLDFLKTYFPDSTHLEQKLKFETYSNGKINDLIKRLQFFESFQSKTVLYFNRYYILQNQPSPNGLKAYCVEYSENQFVLDFYSDSNKVMSLSYTDLVNMKKEGLMHSFYPNGQMKQECVIANESKKRATYYTSDGQVVHSFEKVVYDPDSPYILYTNNFSSIYQNKIPQDSLSFTDEVNKRTIYQGFTGSKIAYSYFVEGGEKVYQLTRPGLNLNLSELQNLFITNAKTRNTSATLKNEAFGYALVLVRVNTKGKITNLKSIHTLTVQHKKTISRVLKSSSVNGLKIGKYRIEGKPVTYEVVIPIYFNKVNKIPNPTSPYNYMQDHQIHPTSSPY